MITKFIFVIIGIPFVIGLDICIYLMKVYSHVSNHYDKYFYTGEFKK